MTAPSSISASAPPQHTDSMPSTPVETAVAHAARRLADLDGAKRELEDLPPLSGDIYEPVRRKLRIAANHHSTAIEGNTLTLVETAEFLLADIPPEGKQSRETLEVRGHDDARSEVEAALALGDDSGEPLTEDFLLRLHGILMRPEVENEAAQSGLPPSPNRPVGGYKSLPNSVTTASGTKTFTAPERTGEAMRALLAWYSEQRERKTHPVAVAAEFHARFAEIHPFYDGNGRMARLLTNLILRRNGYPEAIVPVEDREKYFRLLENADAEGYAPLTGYLADRCSVSLRLFLRCGRGESIEEPDDIDLEIAAFRRETGPRIARADSLRSRELAEQVIFPFYRHFRSKVERLFEYFSENHCSLVVAGKQDSGENFYCRFEEELDTESLPAEGQATSFRLEWLASPLHLDYGVRGIEARAKPSTERDWWSCSFRCGIESVEVRFRESATGADALKLQCNELLRGVMKKLAEPR